MIAHKKQINCCCNVHMVAV